MTLSFMESIFSLAVTKHSFNEWKLFSSIQASSTDFYISAVGTLDTDLSTWQLYVTYWRVVFQISIDWFVCLF